MSTDPKDDRPRRVSSHPDDPDASFADRLLLALGIWPHHAEQAGTDETLDAVVMLRTDAHRFPMVAEDFGNERELRELFQGIVTDLATAASRPTGACKFCGAGGEHTDACIWVRARLAVQDECDTCCGAGVCHRCDGDGCGAGSAAEDLGWCTDGTCTTCGGSGLAPIEEPTDAH